MNAFLFAAEAVLPIILTVAIGYLLGRIGLLGERVSRAVNKLVFRLLLPCMLFLNVYKIEAFHRSGGISFCMPWAPRFCSF